MAEIKWIKIYTGMVSNKKIKRIRKLPEGNNIILIWVFLLAQAGECNRNGALYLTDAIPFRTDDLAIEFDFEVSVIQLALITLERFSMIEMFDEIIYIKNWEEYQNIEGMEKIREQTKKRVTEYRDRKKQLLHYNDDENCNANCNVTVTHGYETELELELDIELDKERDIKDIIPYTEIIDYLNLKAGTNFKPSTKATKEYINGRWREGFREEDFKSVVDKKVVEWKDDPKMSQYIRPNTLFNSEKFEGYLNQISVKNKSSTTDRIRSMYERAKEADEREESRGS